MKRCSHNFRSVIHCKNDICDTSCGKGLDLVVDHRAISELDERFRKSESLQLTKNVSIFSFLSFCCMGFAVRKVA